MTRNSDGTITISFAPDMTITAWGFEDALRKVTDLYRQCLEGTFERPCTPEELAEIGRAHDRIVKAKAQLVE